MITALEASVTSLWHHASAARRGDPAARFALLRLSMAFGEPLLAGRAASILASLRPHEVGEAGEVVQLPGRSVMPPADVEMA